MTNHSKRRLGNVRKLSNGRWLARITSGIKSDGRPRALAKTFDTKEDAEDWLVQKSVELGARPDLGAGVTLSRLWKLYEQDREGKLAKKTLATYAWYMEGSKKGKTESWLDVMGDTDISTITPAMVQRRLDGMSRQKAKHAKSSLSAVLTWATQHDLLVRNPLRGHTFEYRDGPIEEDPFDDDPFAAIEQTRDVWSIDTVLKCFGKIRGLPLEPAWLACVGAGLRVEEALALRKMDVRRIEIGGRMVTQLAIHAARTDLDVRKTTKTRQSKRIVAMLEPFGERYWEIAQGVSNRSDLVCPLSAANQNKRWRGYFAEPSDSKHVPKKDGWHNRGELHDLPYIPLSKMRNTHVTIMAESGVSDSINALMHGHTEMVERRHYLKPDTTKAALEASRRLQLVG